MNRGHKLKLEHSKPSEGPIFLQPKKKKKVELKYFPADSAEVRAAAQRHNCVTVSTSLTSLFLAEIRGFESLDNTHPLGLNMFADTRNTHSCLLWTSDTKTVTCACRRGLAGLHDSSAHSQNIRHFGAQNKINRLLMWPALNCQDVLLLVSAL